MPGNLPTLSPAQQLPAPRPVPYTATASAPAVRVPNATPSQKRKSDALGDESSSPTSPPTKVVDCDAVRAMIRAFIETGEMKVFEFQRAIGVSPTPMARS